MPGGNQNCMKWQLIYRKETERGNIWRSSPWSHLIRIIDSFRKQKVSRDNFLRSLVSRKWLAIAAHYFYTETSLVISPVKASTHVKCFQKTHQDRYGTHQPRSKVGLIKESKWKLSVSPTHCPDFSAPTFEIQGPLSTFCSPDIQMWSRWQGEANE